MGIYLQAFTQTNGTTMKTTDEEVDEVKDALVEFFERQGGSGVVAKSIGMNPQQLHYIVTGRNAPTLKTVMKILRVYPKETQLREALSLPMPSEGEQESEIRVAPVDRSTGELINQLAAKDQLITELVEQLKAAKDELRLSREEIRDLGRDFRQLAVNFPKSGSHVTVRALPIGYKHYDVQNLAGTGKVMMHPSFTPIRRLDSLSPVGQTA